MLERQRTRTRRSAADRLLADLCGSNRRLLRSISGILRQESIRTKVTTLQCLHIGDGGRRVVKLRQSFTFNASGGNGHCLPTIATRQSVIRSRRACRSASAELACVFVSK